MSQANTKILNEKTGFGHLNNQQIKQLVSIPKNVNDFNILQ